VIGSLLGVYNRDNTGATLPHLPFNHDLQMAQVIVVGGGLAGLSAAHTLLERGANVTLLDKQGYVVLIANT
jgi:NADPH-dependent 2,4-dienoyl-CoA reductase/sulfur reductase-like enzyme